MQKDSERYTTLMVDRKVAKLLKEYQRREKRRTGTKQYGMSQVILNLIGKTALEDDQPKKGKEIPAG